VSLRPLALAALWLVAALPAVAQDAKYVSVELVDGTRVVGTVVEDECTDDNLVMRKIRDQAKVTIPWEQVTEDQAHQLRVEYGFDVAEAAEGAMSMQGHEIRNKAGVTFRGLWTNEKTARADGVYVLKTAEGERRIPAGDVKSGPTPVELSQLEVYTPKELYDKKLADLTASHPDGVLTAEDHYQLAEFALLIDALDEAKLHYQQAIDLNDPKYTREKLERRLAQVDDLLAKADARAALKEIQRQIFDRHYDKVGPLIAAFKEKYGSDEDLSHRVADLEEKSKTEREAYYTGVVPSHVRDEVRSLLEKKIKDEKDLTLSQAKQYAEGEPAAEDSVSHAAIAAVAADLGITDEDVLGFWNNRKKLNIYKGFYRDGTFIVIDNLEDALAKAPKLPKLPGGQTAPKLPAPTKPMTPDEWWKGKISAHKTGDLRDWLYAYWAEKSTMCEVLPPKDLPCPTCFGKGYTEKPFTTPQGTLPFYNRCPTCYMAKFQRVVRFR
jgi:hypothetical protein